MKNRESLLATYFRLSRDDGWGRVASAALALMLTMQRKPVLACTLALLVWAMMIAGAVATATEIAKVVWNA